MTDDPKGKTCRPCDWADWSPDGRELICTCRPEWIVVDPDQPACENFVETEE